MTVSTRRRHHGRGLVQQSPDTVDGSPSRVLVVDDDPELRETIGRGLTRSGYDVTFAANGVQALDQLTVESGVDAVITDIDMPVMRGPELADEVLDHHPGVPVLFVSSSRVPHHLLDHPLIDRLTKPVSMRDLRSRVATLLRAAAAYRLAPATRLGQLRSTRPRQSPTGPTCHAHGPHLISGSGEQTTSGS